MQHQLERLVSKTSSKIELKAIISGCASLSRKKLRNFDAAIITKIMKVHGKDIAIKNDRETFARLLVIQRTHEIDIIGGTVT